MSNIPDFVLPGTKPRSYFSKTSLGHLLVSPQRFLDYLHGRLDKSTSGIEFGRIHDKMCFSGMTATEAIATMDVFDDVKVVESIIKDNPASKAPKATKVWKEALAEFNAGLLPSSHVVMRSDLDKAIAMHSVYTNHPLHAFHVEGSKYQVDRTGLIGGYPVRAICDVETPNYVIEGKSTTNLDSFYWDAKKFNYDLQAYILRALFGKDVVFHVQSTEDPYEVQERTCSEAWYEAGEKKYLRACGLYEDYIRCGDENAIRNYYVSLEL